MVACFTHCTSSFETDNSKRKTPTRSLILENRGNKLLHFCERTRLRNRLICPETWISAGFVQLSSMVQVQWFQAHKVPLQRHRLNLHHESVSFHYNLHSALM